MKKKLHTIELFAGCGGLLEGFLQQGYYDTLACVELKFSDGNMIAIDTIAVENEVTDNMYERSELDWLIYNAPAEYADLILNGDPVKYLKTVTVYKPFEN